VWSVNNGAAGDPLGTHFIGYLVSFWTNDPNHLNFQPHIIKEPAAAGSRWVSGTPAALILTDHMRCSMNIKIDLVTTLLMLL
jgi:hypothetical protein